MNIRIFGLAIAAAVLSTSVTAVYAADSCSNWLWQTDGSYWR